MKKKHGLIIGGTGKMGSTLVKAWADQKYDVSVIGRRANAPHEWKSWGIAYYGTDLLKTGLLQGVLASIIHRYGKLDSLVFFQRYRGGRDDWEGELSASLTATKKIIEFTASHFHAQGAIVVVSSVNSHLIAGNLPLSYHVVKAALLQMVRYCAVTLGPKGIRVNSVSPGTVTKPGSRDYYLENKKLMGLYKKIVPLGRLGTAEEVSEVIQFLCGESASYVTGQDIIVDGGVSLQWQESLAKSLA